MSENTLAQHEIFHTCSVAFDFIDRNLLSREDVRPEVRVHIQQAFDSMFEAYQLMGLEESSVQSTPNVL